MEDKYNQLQNKFSINVPVTINKNISYLESYVYAYICKRKICSKTICQNLQINKNKTNKIINKLKKINLIFEENNKFFTNKDIEQKFFIFYENNLLYDTTFLPNLEHLDFQENALYWKLYKYSDPVEGLDNCLTISSKMNIEKISENYLIEKLNFSKYKLHESIKKLKKLKLIKTKRSKNGFYFGIQPITADVKIFWRDDDFLFKSKLFDQKDILSFYENGLVSKKM